MNSSNQKNEITKRMI
jgi:hypothetical protein